MINRWTYLSRTFPDVGPLFEPLEKVLRYRLIPSLTSQETPNDTMRELFALPCRHGGLGIPNLLFLASTQYSNSLALSGPFIPLVLSQSDQIPFHVLEQQIKIKSSIHSQNR